MTRVSCGADLYDRPRSYLSWSIFMTVKTHEILGGRRWQSGSRFQSDSKGNGKKKRYSLKYLIISLHPRMVGTVKG